ncbi:MAG: hypothetical protein COU11_03250 [Candidatus Harrisonbacteria bacterium CG10_big_fil_rev_8_21_14_0_10_49_15]|uniref:5'-3' exonuclease domain-containing protein n=1 Tax=Candidatus Harrisonbacteria bacterium CG10_big_fil_rev_8_21_14_0_10_49_15 TaxID=1974587 RepID=A0A2H0UMD9_9BACT|nr:MAG: hypothetical protein COU11_03250 [Candidatus Harrisonbacteria bacterium CG10_big_fil_rev_8_21_14_0_10_49_15]
MRKLLLIDSHALIHRLFHGMPPLTTEDNEPVGAIYGLCQLLIKIVREEQPDYIAACFDRPEPTFRKQEFEAYKATRAATMPDIIPQLIESRSTFAAFGIPVYELAGYEADDLIATIVENYKDTPDLQIVILSGDRDLLQLVVDEKVVADMIKSGASEVDRYNEEAVIAKYELRPDQIPDLKGLMGDASDNIPGVPNVGQKTATLLLKDFGSVEGVYENLVIIPEKHAKKLEGNKEQALLSKRLATVERAAPIELNGLEAVTAKEFDKERLSAYFKKFGFASLVDRI